jgi:hypothetical protein
MVRRVHRTGDLPMRNGNDVAVPFLVGFAAADSNPEALGRFLDVLDIQGHQLGAAEGAGKADEQEGAVPNACQPAVRQRCHCDDPLGGRWRLLAGHGSKRAPDTPHRRPYPLVVCRQREAASLCA